MPQNTARNHTLAADRLSTSRRLVTPTEAHPRTAKPAPAPLRSDDLSTPRRLLTPKMLSESGEIGPVSERALAMQRVRGDGPPWAAIGRRVYYDLSDVRAWIDARKVNSTSEARP